MSATEPSITTRASRSSAGKVKSDDEEPMSPPKSPMRRPPSPRKAASEAKKKETFQWNTPADEFADDVGSEDEGEYLDGDDEDDFDGDDEEGIVIELGGDNQNFTVIKGGKKLKGESHEEIAKFLADYGAAPGGEQEAEMRKTAAAGGSTKKKAKQRFQCPKCEKIWNWPWELRRHVLTHYREKERQQTSTFKCEECGKGFQWKRDLAQHRRLHTGEKLLVCSVCNKKFTTRQALLHHVVVHTGEKPFQCALCGNRFTQPANLRTHMKKKHGDSNARTNKCPHCSETLPSIIQMHQHILEDHQDIVAEVREGQELVVLKKSKEKEERARQREENKKKREEKRSQNIDYNDFRACKGMQEWEINYEFHIGEGLVRGVDWDRTPSNGELNCDICDRQFAWRYELMFHSLCHKTDENGVTRNKVCPECDTAFKVPIGLKHHLLLHTGELPFLCLHCWRSFSSHIDLKLHIRKEHLFHLETPDMKPLPSKKSTPAKVKTEAKTPKTKRAAKATFDALQNTVVQGHQIVTQDGLAPGEMHVVVQEGENGEQHTLLVGADGTIMQTGGEDMIVVIQSDETDQNGQQTLMVVDPSQLQHMVGPDGQTIQVFQGANGETMAVMDNSLHQLAEAAEEQGTKMIVTSDGVETGTETKMMFRQEDGSQFAPGTIITTSDGQQHTVVSNEEDGEIEVTPTNGEGASSDQMIVSDSAASTAAPTSIEFNGEGMEGTDGGDATEVDVAEGPESKLGIIAAVAEKAVALEIAPADDNAVSENNSSA